MHVKIGFLLLNNIGIFLLVFARVLGIFVSAPVFNQKNVPVYVKLGFSLIFSMIIFPVIKVPLNLELGNFYILLLMSVKELMVGIMIGFIGYLFFSLLYLAGRIADMQIGFAMVSVINPQDDTQIPLMGSFFYTMAILIFLSTNGHHVFIQSLKYSFDHIPLGGLRINIFMIDKLIEIMSVTFVISFKIAAPILISIFISNVLLGILARTMPQMNVFVVGMPLKILVGLVVIILVFPLYVGVFEHIFDLMFENIHEFINLMAKG